MRAGENRLGSDRARHSLFWSRTSLRLLVLLCTALPLSWLPALVSAPQMTVMDETWTVFRRYSRFREMHKALRLKHPEVGDVLQTFSSPAAVTGNPAAADGSLLLPPILTMFSPPAADSGVPAKDAVWKPGRATGGGAAGPPGGEDPCDLLLHQLIHPRLAPSRCSCSDPPEEGRRTPRSGAADGRRF